MSQANKNQLSNISSTLLSFLVLLNLIVMSWFYLLITVVVPVFGQNHQSEKFDITLKEVIANCNIHLERVVQRLKIFNIKEFHSLYNDVNDEKLVYREFQTQSNIVLGPMDMELILNGYCLMPQFRNTTFTCHFSMAIHRKMVKIYTLRPEERAIQNENLCSDLNFKTKLVGVWDDVEKAYLDLNFSPPCCFLLTSYKKKRSNITTSNDTKLLEDTRSDREIIRITNKFACIAVFTILVLIGIGIGIKMFYWRKYKKIMVHPVV